MNCIVEGLLVGLLAGVTIFYGFQTRAIYPHWLLRIFDHPWMLLLALIAACLSIPSQPRLGAMMVIFVIALWMDFVLFAREPYHVKDPRVSLPSKDELETMFEPRIRTAEPLWDDDRIRPSHKDLALNLPRFPEFHESEGKNWMLL
jgi:hypothetical protein